MIIVKKLLVVVLVLSSGTCAAFYFRKSPDGADASDRFTQPLNLDSGSAVPGANSLNLRHAGSAAPGFAFPNPAGDAHLVDGDSTEPNSEYATAPTQGTDRRFELRGESRPGRAAEIHSSTLPPLPSQFPNDTEHSPLRPIYSTVESRRVGGRTRADSRDETPERHRVVDGDTLETVARLYFKDAGMAVEIFELNRDRILNPGLLPIGLELQLPRLPGSEVASPYAISGERPVTTLTPVP